jgi:hypothetical protein
LIFNQRDYDDSQSFSGMGIPARNKAIARFYRGLALQLSSPYETRQKRLLWGLNGGLAVQTLVKPIYYGSRADQIRLWHLTDLHVGARACDEKLLQQHIDVIASDPNAYWIGGGDYVDAICDLGDKRFVPNQIARWLWGETDVMGAQVRRVIGLLAPIASKCLGMVGGNHESAAYSFYRRELFWDVVCGVASAARVDPSSLALGYQGYIRVVFRRGNPQSYGNAWAFDVRVHHGYGHGKNHYGTLVQAMADFDADLTLFGHRHVKAFADGANATAPRCSLHRSSMHTSSPPPTKNPSIPTSRRPGRNPSHSAHCRS